MTAVEARVFDHHLGERSPLVLPRTALVRVGIEMSG
jgi:hypothetical protein